jgi:hypothetical protein
MGQIAWVAWDFISKAGVAELPPEVVNGTDKEETQWQITKEIHGARQR